MKIDLLLYHVAYASVAVLLTQSLTYVWKSRLFSLGHHGFFGIGAYAAAVLAQATFPPNQEWFLATPAHRLAGVGALLASIAVAALVAGLVAALTGRLLRHVRGDYFAVATLILAEIVYNVASNWSLVGGAIGFEVPYLFANNGPNERFIFIGAFAAVGVLSNVLLFLLIRRLDASTYGLWIAALLDDDLALQSCGVNVVAMQKTIFTLAGAVAGIAGAIFLHLGTLIMPGDFSFINGLPVILFVVLGGYDQRRCIVAAVAGYAVYELLKLQFFGLGGSPLAQLVATWRESLWGVVLVLAVIIPAWRSRSRRTVTV